ncbi:hypothetical protein [Pedobacter steynii]|uniref:Uncharacterized protein n=1 Tax=Pedobacter steynii TaxID=430522 RepID=A0A1D7QLI8_9SPHI|nr:hypothetical protein [Pedobacter steynii]AOM79535.1 hypothetical protein BFS30_21665 [Pedobacter steynii]
MKTFYIIALAAIFCLDSSAQIKNYDNTGSIKIIGEKTTLKLIKKEISLETGEEAGGLLAAVGTIAPALINLGVKAVQEKIKREALKYTGTYKASGSADGFYADPGYVKPPIVQIERMVLISGNKPDTASRIIFIPELSMDKTAFRFRLDPRSFKYRYSVAKIRPGYNALDLTVEIKVRSLTIASGEYKLSELRTVLVTIPMVQVNAVNLPGNDIVSGWIPFPPKSSFETTGVKSDTVTKVTRSENILTKKTAAHSAESSITSTSGVKVPLANVDSFGPYEVEVVVTETNPFKIKAEQRTAFVDLTAESATALLQAILEAVVPKPKE